MSVIDLVINWCISIADDNRYLYSQTLGRWGKYSHSTAPWYYDCSSFVSDAFSRFTGIDYTNNHTMYTGDMYSFFTSHKFMDVTSGHVVRRGDVLLTHNAQREHTCIYIGTTPVADSASKYVIAAHTHYPDDPAKDISAGYDSNTYQYILRYIGELPPWEAQERYGWTHNNIQAQNNAINICDILLKQGFSLAAVASILGNMEAESGLNPWRWQNDIILSSTSVNRYSLEHGYGLVQFTPMIDYENWGRGKAGYGPNYSDIAGRKTDGHAQTLAVASDALNKYSIRSWAPAQFRISWAQFKVVDSVDIGTGAWLYNYESPTDPGSKYNTRLSNAQFWMSYLGGYSPIATTIPYWLIKMINDNEI